jgi:methenyltetrahydromethanopterin cyclohydrolase
MAKTGSKEPQIVSREGPQVSASENSGRATASVNRLAGEIVDRLVAGADTYRVAVSRGSLGELLVDAGAKAAGGVEAGLLLTEICMGGLGRITLSPAPGAAKWPFWLTVSSNDPVVACLASQYAGWSLQHEKFFALGSGPGRAQARVEKLFEELTYKYVRAYMEDGKMPPDEIAPAILNMADDYMSGRQVAIRAGDYIALQNFIRKETKSS